jgi:hypothetical protein
MSKLKRKLLRSRLRKRKQEEAVEEEAAGRCRVEEEAVVEEEAAVELRKMQVEEEAAIEIEEEAAVEIEEDAELRKRQQSRLRKRQQSMSLPRLLCQTSDGATGHVGAHGGSEGVSVRSKTSTALAFALNTTTRYFSPLVVDFRPLPAVVRCSAGPAAAHRQDARPTQVRVGRGIT